ncbi:MAG: carboxysome shell protein, partial [Betaproteobacteria bacterium]|nr:carboxysome shell protein [Betaproteobacteria bacterium]
YVGEDNRPAFCAAPQPAAAVAAQPQTFSILTPGHAALGRERGRGVTGSAMGTERITGPGNKAEGLITGTPEFRRHEPRPQREAAPAPAAAPDGAPRGAQRLSGEGSQQGPRISGDVWMDRSRVTGTEGPSALSRNPSLRGQPRGAAAAAAPQREAERAPVPPSRVTGSSGNSERGAVVTVSGGARG